MRVEHREIAFEDSRGVITDVLLGTPVEHVAVFTSARGSTRGGHYHKESTAYVFVLAGAFRIDYRTEHGPVACVAAGAGDLVTIDPLERHELVALEHSVFLMLTHGPQGGRQFDGDTVRDPVHGGAA